MRDFEVWAPQASSGVELLLGDERVPLTRGDGGWWRASAPADAGTPYWFSLDGGDPRPDPRSRRLPEGPHGPSAVFDPTAFALDRRAVVRRRAGRQRHLRAARRHVHRRGHARCGRRPAGPPGRPRRHPRRAAAAGRFPGRQRLGLRRRRAVRGARAVRRPGGAAAVRRRLPRQGTRRLPRRRLQPPRAGRQLPGRVRAVLHRPLRDPVGLGDQPRRPAERPGARVRGRQRADVAARLPRRRAAAGRGARAVRQPRPAGARGPVPARWTPWRQRSVGR